MIDSEVTDELHESLRTKPPILDMLKKSRFMSSKMLEKPVRDMLRHSRSISVELVDKAKAEQAKAEARDTGSSDDSSDSGRSFSSLSESDIESSRKTMQESGLLVFKKAVKKMNEVKESEDEEVKKFHSTEKLRFQSLDGVVDGEIDEEGNKLAKELNELDIGKGKE